MENTTITKVTYRPLEKYLFKQANYWGIQIRTRNTEYHILDKDMYKLPSELKMYLYSISRANLLPVIETRFISRDEQTTIFVQGRQGQNPIQVKPLNIDNKNTRKIIEKLYDEAKHIIPLLKALQNSKPIYAGQKDDESKSTSIFLHDLLDWKKGLNIRYRDFYKASRYLHQDNYKPSHAFKILLDTFKGKLTYETYCRLVALFLYHPKPLDLGYLGDYEQDILTNAQYSDYIGIEDIKGYNYPNFSKQVFSHGLDFETSSDDIVKNLENIVKFVYKKGKTTPHMQLCTSLKNTPYGTIGVLLKGKCLLVGYPELYSSYNQTDGTRSIPSYVLIDGYVKSEEDLKKEEKIDYCECLVEPKEIVAIYSERYNAEELIKSEQPELYQFIKRKGIPFITKPKK